MEKCYVVHPTGDEQLAVQERVRALLATHAERDMGDDMPKARLNMAALVLESVGGRDTFDSKMMNYFFGLRGDVPAAQVSGLGSLSLSSDGQLEGRPGFLRSAFSEDEIRGAPGRAFRHRSAWHYLREFIDTIRRRYGVKELEAIYDNIHPRVSQALAEEAEKLLRNYRGTSSDHKMLWLAIVLNSARSNLWLGPSKENISINSSGYHLKRWTKELDLKQLDIPKYRAKVAAAKFGSRKARAAQAEVLEIIKEAGSVPDPLTYIVNHVHIRCLSRLEVDLPDEGERESAPHHMRIYEIAHDIGGLADRLEIIESLLGLERSRRRSRSRSPDSRGSGSRGRSRSRSPSPSPPRRRGRSSLSPPPSVRVRAWGPFVAVDSLDEAAKRSWNAGDCFELPDGRRYGLNSDHHGGLEFIRGELRVFLRGG